MKINSIETDQRLKYEGIVNGSVNSISFIKSKGWLALGHDSALTFYSQE